MFPAIASTRLKPMGPFTAHALSDMQQETAAEQTGGEVMKTNTWSW